MAKHVTVTEDGARRAGAEWKKILEGDAPPPTGESDMDAASKARLEQAEKEARDAAKRAADAEKKNQDLEARMQRLESCRDEADKAGKARAEEDAAETKRLARIVAEHTVSAARVEAEAARLAGFGRPALEEIMARTPAPKAVGVRLRGNPAASAEAAAPSDGILGRIEEVVDEHGAREVPVFTVTDWTKHGAETPAGHKTARATPPVNAALVGGVRHG